MTDYTPTTGSMRIAYVYIGEEATPGLTAERAAAFDNWLAAHVAEIRRDQIEKDAAIVLSEFLRTGPNVKQDAATSIRNQSGEHNV